MGADLSSAIPSLLSRYSYHLNQSLIDTLYNGRKLGPRWTTWLSQGHSLQSPTQRFFPSPVSFSPFLWVFMTKHKLLRYLGAEYIHPSWLFCFMVVSAQGHTVKLIHLVFEINLPTLVCLIQCKKECYFFCLCQQTIQSESKPAV